MRLVPALKAVLLCALLGGSAVGYAIQKNRIQVLGGEIAAKEQKLERLAQQNTYWASLLASHTLPQKIAERVKEQNLGLQPAHPAQVIWLAEPPAPAGTNGAPEMLALWQ